MLTPDVKEKSPFESKLHAKGLALFTRLGPGLITGAAAMRLKPPQTPQKR